MFRYRKEGVSVITVVDKRRQKISGLFPVKIEVISRKVQKYFQTGVDVSDTEWEEFWSNRNVTEKYSEVESIFNRVRNHVEYLLERRIFSLQNLEHLMGRSSLSVNGALRDKMKKCLAAGKVNSYYRCRTTLHAMERFCRDEVTFQSVTSVWLKRCEQFWMKEGLSCTTVNVYMKTIKSTFSEAMEYGIIRDMPFGKGRYTIPQSRRRDLALSKDDLKMIYNYKGAEADEMYRDLWLFSYLCNGINFRDMLSLRFCDIVNGEVVFCRSKTRHALNDSTVIRAVMRPEMEEIIRRWGNVGKGLDAFIFPFVTGKESPLEMAALVRKVIAECNNSLKRISQELDIARFTTYSARHSFATILQKSGATIHFISKSLGHKNIITTEHYLGDYGHEERVEASRALMEF